MTSFMTMTGAPYQILAESFKTMNWPGRTVTLINGLFLGKYKRKFNFDTIIIKVFNFCYQNLESISSIVWKLCVLQQRSNFGNFQQFSFHGSSTFKFRIVESWWLSWGTGWRIHIIFSLYNSIILNTLFFWYFSKSLTFQVNI